MGTDSVTRWYHDSRSFSYYLTNWPTNQPTNQPTNERCFWENL